MADDDLITGSHWGDAISTSSNTFGFAADQPADTSPDSLAAGLQTASISGFSEELGTPFFAGSEDDPYSHRDSASDAFPISGFATSPSVATSAVPSGGNSATASHAELSILDEPRPKPAIKPFSGAQHATHKPGRTPPKPRAAYRAQRTKKTAHLKKIVAQAEFEDVEENSDPLAHAAPVSPVSPVSPSPAAASEPSVRPAGSRAGLSGSGEAVSGPNSAIPATSATGSATVASNSEPSEPSDPSEPPAPPAPHFEISVGDPIKVGDLTSAHTVYTVRTRTNSHQFLQKDTTVTRRYRDFRWIYHQLENNHPGVLVPPPPEKQAYGRFDEHFVESRRLALESMLQRIVRNPVLACDEDFVMFLQSERFSQESREREKSTGSGASRGDSGDGAETTGGGSGGGGGIFGSWGPFSFTGKFVETDEWFASKKSYIEALDTQLKSMSKGLDIVVAQRKELAGAIAEFAKPLLALAELEVSRELAEMLEAFAETEERLRELYERVNMQEMLTLGNSVDEYIRTIGSVRHLFQQRVKQFEVFQKEESELIKKRNHLEKVLRQGKTQQDKIQFLKEEIAVEEKTVLNAKVQFDDISKRIKQELDGRFESEKIADFRNCVETFLESSIESQKQSIELWETFYQRQRLAQPGPKA